MVVEFFLQDKKFCMALSIVFSVESNYDFLQKIMIPENTRIFLNLYFVTMFYQHSKNE